MAYTRRRYLTLLASAALLPTSMLLASCAGNQVPPTTAPSPTIAPPAASPASGTSGAASASPTVSTPTASTPVAFPAASTLKARIALTASDAAFLIALDQGMFQDVGLSIELVTATLDPGQALSLLGAGQLDLVGGGISAALVNALKQGVPLKIVIAQTVLTQDFGDFHVLGVAKSLSSEIRSVADLRGRTIALVTSSGGDVLETKKVFAAHGLALRDVQIQTLRAPDVPTALQNAAVAAGFLIEPYVTIALKQLEAALPLVRGQEIAQAAGTGLPLNVLTFGPRLLQDRSLAVAFLTAYLRGVVWYFERIANADKRQEIAAILKKYTPLKDDQLYAQMTWPPVARDGRFDVKFLNEYQALWSELGQVQGPVSVEDLVDFSYLDEAAKQL